MEVKTVGVACDHAGYPLKKFVLQYLEEKGYPYKDYGTWSDASVDYPDFGHALAEGIESGEVYPGIAICGSGEGISITLNDNHHVRFLPLNDLEAWVRELSRGGVCAAILEPIQGVGGIQMATPEFAQKLAYACKRYGVTLICDEIQCGYGRSGRFFAHQWLGIK